VEKDFDIEDVSIDGTLFQTFQDRPLSRYVSSPKRLQQVSDFLVHEALRLNPNKKQLLENMRVVHRQEKQNQRRFYLPTLAVQASFGEVLGRSGSGSDPLSMQGFEDSSWQAAVVMSYPLFQNGDRRVELQRTRVQLEQLELNDRKLNNAIELSVRSGALSLLRANTNITFSKTASDNAHSNFELIQQSYERGAVTITQLIDAQNAALQAKLAHAISIYELMLAQIQLEYRVGSFLTLAPAEQQHDFLQRFHAYQSQSTQP
jgi:outer membrane protein TolC